MLGSQITNNSKKGLGYNVVPPPHPLIYNAPTKLDLSYSGLDEFKEPEFKGYGPRNDKQESNISCDKKSDNSEENIDDSLVKEQVSEDDNSSVESPLKVDNKTVIHTAKKVEFVTPKNDEKPNKKSVRFLALEWHLEEIHVTWAYLDKKQTRLRTYTKSMKKYYSQSVETASQA
ncbi:hypothetical protein Tco_0953843 [Tanacetum coccineum]|uniref:Uncharacterized protein n=1 Tax=Tanacetum coccineum TaxID=301880 RepID=A0ABQ5E1E5_9ASTR